MKTLAKRLCTAIFALILFNSCSSLYYPNQVNAPLLSKKGDLEVSAGKSVSVYQLGTRNGFEAQGAYAFTNHLAGIADISVGSTPASKSFYEYDYKHDYIGAGIGYYTRAGKHFRFSVFGGYGESRAEAKYMNWYYSQQRESKFKKIFVQPSFGFRSRVFDMNFSIRAARVFEERIDYRSEYIDTSFIVNSHQIQVAWTTIEPALTVQVGYDPVKIFAQACVSNVITLSAGLKIRFNTLKKEK